MGKISKVFPDLAKDNLKEDAIWEMYDQFSCNCLLICWNLIDIYWYNLQTVNIMRQLSPIRSVSPISKPKIVFKYPSPLK